MIELRWILVSSIALVATAGAAHALLTKRDPRAALGWIAVCLMFPIAGPLLYYLFGINRIRARATKLIERASSVEPGQQLAAQWSSDLMPGVPRAFAGLHRLSDTLTDTPLVPCDGIDLLHNGEQAYPAMLEAIENAAASLYLVTYIFETNTTGRRFIDALARASARGVDVRVIVDGVGEFYSMPRAGVALRKRGVRVARFLPPRLIPPSVHINLRNHRKLLVADGAIGFTGGMNIGDRHLAANTRNPKRVVDIHFRLTGPVVAQLEAVFHEDWAFITGEQTVLTLPTPSPNQTGEALCRTVVDGPTGRLEKLSMIMAGAISTAGRRIVIMTPYFLPSRVLIAALQEAALRGVEVNVVLPAKNNLPFVYWATCNMLWELLERGVRVYLQPPPFVHSKLILIDDEYAQIGSVNIDARSMRLNYELAIEVYGAEFARRLGAHYEEVRAHSRRLALEDVEGRSLPIRIRDAITWLFTPYL